MAINSITISQDNKVGASNLMPIHSTLVFLVDVEFTGSYPLKLFVDFIVDGNILDTFKAIPYKDILANTRQFAFVANDVVKGLMNDFSDTYQLNETIVHIQDITKTATLKFRDPDNELTFATIDVTFIHGAAQFGDNPNLDAIYNNDDSIYYGPDGGFVYMYFYNDDVNNILTIDSPTVRVVYAEDYDGAVFEDFNGNLFEIDVPI